MNFLVANTIYIESYLIHFPYFLGHDSCHYCQFVNTSVLF